MLRIWTDGGCWPNPGNGGWAWLIERNGDVLALDSGSEARTTNNRMEMRAALNGIASAPDNHLEVVSDSNYLVKGMTLWLPRWIEKNWKVGGKSVKNAGLWKDLSHAVHLHPAPVRFRWVRGHSGNPFNEQVDKMAQEARLAIA